MSRTTRSHPRRPLVVTGFILTALAVSAATAQAQSPSPERALLDRIPAATYRKSDLKSAYFAEFTGVGAEGRDMVWQGAIAGAAVGELTVRLAHVAVDGASRLGPQPVEGILFVSGDDPRRAFAAEVTGTMDLQAGRVAVAGQISEGYRVGERIEYTAELIDLDLSGELRLAPATLAAAH